MLPTTTLVAMSMTFTSVPGADAAPAFAGYAPVSTGALQTTSGGSRSALTLGIVKALSQTQSHADLQNQGHIARVEMDVWWGSIGSELIATAIRNAGAE
jgi:hypothetical protein